MTKEQLEEIGKNMGQAFYKDVLVLTDKVETLKERIRTLERMGIKMWHSHFFPMKDNDLPFHEWSNEMEKRTKSIFTCPDCCVDPCRCDLEDIARMRKNQITQLEKELAATEQVSERQRERAKNAEKRVQELTQIIKEIVKEGTDMADKYCENFSEVPKSVINWHKTVDKHYSEE